MWGSKGVSLLVCLYRSLLLMLRKEEAIRQRRMANALWLLENEVLLQCSSWDEKSIPLVWPHKPKQYVGRIRELPHIYPHPRILPMLLVNDYVVGSQYHRARLVATLYFPVIEVMLRSADATSAEE